MPNQPTCSMNNNENDPSQFDLSLFFNDPNIERKAPEDMRFISVSVEPYEDGRRLRVAAEVTPFEKRPYFEFTLYDGQGREVSAVSVVEPARWKIDFVMHIRARFADQSGPYRLFARLYYPEMPDSDTHELTVEVPEQS